MVPSFLVIVVNLWADGLLDEHAICGEILFAQKWSNRSFLSVESGGGEKFQYQLRSQKESHLHVDDSCSRNPFYLSLLSISSYSYHDNIPTIYFCTFQPGCSLLAVSFLNLQFWMNLHVNYLLLSVFFLSLLFSSLLSFLLSSF